MIVIKKIILIVYLIIMQHTAAKRCKIDRFLCSYASIK